MKIGHNLIHFHKGFVSQEGLDGVTMDLDKVRKLSAKRNGYPSILPLSEHSLRLTRLLLIIGRKLYNNTTPNKAWKSLFCRTPAKILANKVYSSPILSVQDGKGEQ